MITRLVWSYAVVLLYIPVFIWIWRRRRFPEASQLPEAEMRRLLPRIAMLWMLTGVFWGSVLWCGVLAAMNGALSLLPPWMPPTAVFVPMMLGQICQGLASRPRPRRS
jgi:UDP-N-acetylmuramyl pentapeptide phosphotransferase/UDP-N-acetylglucosamine-1-phosphate transferase